MKKQMQVWCSTGAILGALVVGAVDSDAGHRRELIELSKSEVFFEENTTDEDLGFHLFADGQGWKRLLLFAPNGRLLANVSLRGSLKSIGLTELFSESAEPGFIEIPRDEFLGKFPEGVYTYIGLSINGDWLYGRAEVTHDIPEGPEIIYPLEDQVVDPTEDLVLQWEIVDDPNPPDSVVEFYEVVVAKDEEDERTRIFSVEMLPTDMTVTVPAEFLEPGKAYKGEIIAEETSGNRASAELTFETAD